MPKQFVHNGRCNRPSPAINKIHNLGHGWNSIRKILRTQNKIKTRAVFGMTLVARKQGKMRCNINRYRAPAFLCPGRSIGLWLADEHSRPTLACADLRIRIDGVPEGIDRTQTDQQREDRIASFRSRAYEPAGAREVALSAATSVQSGGLVPLGRGSLRQSPTREQAYLR